MTIDKDCPLNSNITPATAADIEAALADLPPLTDAELRIAASFALDLSPADIAEIKRFGSPVLRAVEAEQERRHKEIAAKSAKQARDDYALRKKVETGEAPRAYNPTGIAPRDLREGHFEIKEEYQRRYDRELKQSKRPKFVPLTDEEKKERKRAANAKRNLR